MAIVFAAPVRGQTPPLVWGGDAEGGAPFVEADPNDPSKVVGFDVEVADLIARGLGRAARFKQVAYTSLDQSARRGDFDIALGGVEDSPARRARLVTTVPYYEFREVLVVRAADRGRFRTLADLRGRRVGTLGGTMAYEILVQAESPHALTAVSYDDDVHPYSDLAQGRLDAVLLDEILATRGVRRNPSLAIVPDTVATGHYVGVLAPGHTALRDRIDEVLRAAMRDGSLERIFRRWQVWTDDQPALYARVAGTRVPSGTAETSRPRQDAVTVRPPEPASAEAGGPDLLVATRRYLPALVRAAGITIVLSCLSMALAVGLGVLVASGRVYGSRPLQVLLTGYVEITRGTPVLLQLFVLYYGLASIVDLPAFLAAFLGLGLNYAAYESEIYRGALQAVPVGQLEAARALGLTDWQSLALVRGPQAFRLALAPMTNDFVALLKDSSLVSVLTVVELTKQTQIFAANVGSWALPGALCAAMYLAMSLPLARLARRLERRWAAPAHV